ncbi:MAG: outer membrane protein assembly factor BamD [Pseudomonadota bacterium]
MASCLSIIRPIRLIILASASALVLAACGSSDDELIYIERPPEQIYEAGLNALGEDEFDLAAAEFNEVERQHPYSLYATEAQLLAAYSYYQNLDYDQAILAFERFIELHPGNPDVAYAYYMRALCYYEQIVDVERDQNLTELAAQTLEDVIRRFPDSVYARDAQLKYDLTQDQLAGQEMSIGRYYLRQNEMSAAINRFRSVVDNYQTTSHTPEALYRLTEAYMSLGLNQEAERTATVLGANFPGSEWYRNSYALLVDGDVPQRSGFFSRTFGSIF